MRVEVRSIKPIGGKIIKCIRSWGDKVVAETPDVRVVAYYDKILTENELIIPTINLHPGYLPYNRGVHTHIWPLVDGTPAGVTIHFINTKIDQGEIIAQKKVKVYPNDIASTLQKRIDHEMFELFAQVWPKIRGGKVKTRQQTDKGTYHWRKDALSIQEFDYDTIARLRACTFDDRSYAFFKYKREKIHFGIKFYD